MKVPFERMRVNVSTGSTLITIAVLPPVKNEAEAWDVAKWVEEAIREKLKKEQGQP
jgi:hypothetical protein